MKGNIAPLRMDVQVTKMIVTQCDLMVDQIREFCKEKFGAELWSVTFRAADGSYYVWTSEYPAMTMQAKK